MKPVLKDPFFCGIVSLQLAAFSSLFSASFGETLSLSNVSDWMKGARFSIGHTLPMITAYDLNGVRQPLLLPHTKSILISGTCTCDDFTTKAWLDKAKMKGQNPTLVVPIQSDSSMVPKRMEWNGRTLYLRPGDLQKWGLLKGRKSATLPALFQLDDARMIRGIVHE
jgi:hypothetical protein